MTATLSAHCSESASKLCLGCGTLRFGASPLAGYCSLPCEKAHCEKREPSEQPTEADGPSCEPHGSIHSPK